MEYKNKLNERLLKFAVSIVKLVAGLPKTPVGNAIASQLVRSGTSVGANYEEAQDASSRKDFLNKTRISLREARETLYWLKVVKLSGLVVGSDIEDSMSECNEIVSILVKSVKTIKSKI